MDKYNNFPELKKYEKEGKDYIIRYRDVDSDTAIMAPHGGGIEPGTLDLADEIAGKDFSFYSFSGIKKRGNSTLHIGSTRFDEPVALEIARKAFTVITLHGCRGEDEIVYTGGKNNEIKFAISGKLTDAGFNVKHSQNDDLNGNNDTNICNRCRSGKGVQLEISMGLRNKMFEKSDGFSGAARTEKFNKFVSAVRSILLYNYM